MNVQELTRPKEPETQLPTIDEDTAQQERTSFLEQSQQEPGE